MKNKKRRLALIVTGWVLLISPLAFAQDMGGKGENDLKISGELWMGARLNLTEDHGNATNYDLDRAQLNLDKKVNDLFTAAIKIEKMGTSHVEGYYFNDSGEKVYTGNVALGIYLKEATIKITPINGPMSLYFVAGIPETPTGQFMEDLKGDYMFNLDETEFTESFTDEKKYDAALGFGFRYKKLVDAYFTMGHGDGYKNLGGQNAPDYKYAYNGRITISPIDQFKVSGFFTVDNHKPQDEWVELHEDDILAGALQSSTTLRTGISSALTGYSLWNKGDYNGDGYANTSDYVDGLNYLASVSSTFAAYKQQAIEAAVDAMDVKSGVYGGGIAWTDSSIRAGFNYFYLTQKLNDDKTQKDGDQVFDFWANVNLKEFTGFPVAIYTGYSYMNDKNTKENGVSVEDEGKAVDVTEWFVGAGYEFSGEAGLYLFYREYDEDISSFDKEKDVKAVATLKF